MASTPNDPMRVVCPACGKRYRIAPDSLAQALRCKCDHVFLGKDHLAPDNANGAHDAAESPAPGMAAPGIAGPDIAAPGIASPDIAAPNNAAPNNAPPGIAGPDIAAPNNAPPGIAGPDIAAPNNAASKSAAWSSSASSPGIAAADARAPDAPGTAPTPAPDFGVYAAASLARKQASDALLQGQDEGTRRARITDFYVPIAMLALLAPLHAVLWLMLTDRLWLGLLGWLGLTVVQVLIFLPTALFTVISVARWFELALGKLPPLVLKLGAIVLASGALADLFFMLVIFIADFDWWLLAGGFAAYAVAIGLPAAILLEMNLQATMVWVMMNFLLRVPGAYVALLVVPKLFD